MSHERPHQPETAKPWWKKIIDNIPWTAIAATAAGFIIGGIPGAIIAGGVVAGYKTYKAYKAKQAEQKSASNPQPTLQDASKPLKPQQHVKTKSFQPLAPDPVGRKHVVWGKGSKTRD